MIKIRDIVAKYKSTYAAGKDLGINPAQLRRWVNLDAQVEDNGDVWIKTKGNVGKLWPESNERIDAIARGDHYE